MSPGRAAKRVIVVAEKIVEPTLRAAIRSASLLAAGGSPLMSTGGSIAS